MPNLAVTIPFVFDSELAIRNGGGDPWAKDYLKNNVAGGGAFKVEAWRPGTETIYTRNDDWQCGALPKLRRVIARDIPSPSTRRALIERGDADISYGLPPKDFKDLADAGKIKVAAVPVPNAIWYVALNSALPPFNNVKLRQAVAWALPYEKIMQASLFGRGVPMWGGPSTPAELKWPVPFPYTANMDARQGADGGVRRGALQHHAAVRRRLRHHRRADGGAGEGGAGAARHHGGAEQDPGRQFPRRAEQEDGADGDQPLRRLAGLAGLLLLLELPRQ